MFFFNTNIKTKKLKSDIESILKKLITQPHKCALSTKNENIETYIVKVENGFIIKEIDPNFSYLINIGEKVNFKIVALFDFEQYNIDFVTQLSGITEDPFHRQLIFNFPEEIKFLSELLEIVPFSDDKVTISFSMNNITEFRSVSVLTEKVIHFEAPMEHLLKYYENRTIYNIELKLPYEKIILAGVFRRFKKEQYGFTDFLLGVKNHEALLSYFQYYFMRFYGIPSLYDEKQYKSIREDKNKIGSIYICDDKPAVTEYLYEFLSHRIQYPIIQINNFEDIFSISEQYEPALIIIDAQLPDLDVIDVFKKLQKLQCPIIFLVTKKHAAQLNYLEEAYYKGYIYKPVDGYQLLNKIKSILEIE